MAWFVRIEKNAAKALSKLSKSDQVRILNYTVAKFGVAFSDLIKSSRVSWANFTTQEGVSKGTRL